MKSKELVYLASTAVLLAATANVVQAEEKQGAEVEALTPADSGAGKEQETASQAPVPFAAPTASPQSDSAAASLPSQPSEPASAASSQTAASGTAQSQSEDLASVGQESPAQSQALAQPVGGQQPEQGLTPAGPAVKAAEPTLQASSSSKAGASGLPARPEAENQQNQSLARLAAPAQAKAASQPGGSQSQTAEPSPAKQPVSKGYSGFYNAGSGAQPARSNPQAEIKGSSFIDVSSHNGHLSVDDYRKLQQRGIGGVVVKLTEGTHYTNPFAESQVKNAQAAGLKVSTYAFSHYTSNETAKAEARYFAAAANRLGLTKDTLMVNDMEDPKMQAGINQHTQAWKEEMQRLGFSNLMYYTSASWLDQNNLRGKGPVNTRQFGYQNFWVAQYPSAKLNYDGAKSLKYNSGAGAWQFTSKAELLPGRHVFDQSVDYSGRFTKAAKPVSSGPVRGKISIQNNNSLTGTFDVLVTEVSAPAGIKEVKIPTWSAVNGQDDLVWYSAAKQANGSYKLTVKASNHKNATGLYHAHVYYSLDDNRLVGLGTATAQVEIGKVEKLSGKITIANKNSQTGSFDVLISEVSGPSGVGSVSVPVWSTASGQDDLVWYQAAKQTNGTYKVSVSVKNHKNSTGEYNVHLYYNLNNGQKVGVGGTKTTVEIGRVQPAQQPVRKAAGQLVIENNNATTGSFDAVVRNIVAPDGLKEVLVPTWSEVNGQDDLIWHKAAKQADGSYRVTVKASEHKQSTGKYHIHLYYIDGNNKRSFVTGTVTEVHHTRPTGQLVIENNNRETGSFDAVVRNIVAPDGLKEVLVPTWSEVNGQDDLIWHKAAKQADGSYRVTIKASEHKQSTGKYHTHLYFIDGNNKRSFVTGTVTEVRQTRPTGQLVIENNNSTTGSFDAVVRNIVAPDGLKEVFIPTWSQDKGQDDLIWHKAAKQADGSYRVTIKASEHKQSTGKYHVHLYYIDGNNKRSYITETVTEVRQSRPTGKLTIQNNNANAGTFDVLVSDVYSPKGVAAVSVPVWSSANGQDDLVWYQATKQANGTYKVSVSAKNHKNSTGEYNVHLYYVQADGQQVGIGATRTQVNMNHLSVQAEDVNKDQGTYRLVISQASTSKKIKEVKVAVWSEDGQQNLHWYRAQPTADNKAQVLVNAANHKNASGNYITHVYVDYTDNSTEGYNAGSYHLTPNPGQQSNQRDRVLAAAARMVGTTSGDERHRKLVEDYNSVRPLPVGYAVKTTDDWCDIFVTVVFQREGLSDLIGRECGVERHVQIFKQKGIWNEDGNTTPKAGDIITFNWDQNQQQNDGWADHIGIVEKVENGIIHTIEGNSTNRQARRNTYRVGHGNIRGFATPRYR